MTGGHGDNGVVQRVCALISEAMDVSPESLPLREDSRLRGMGMGLDSLDALHLLVAVEDEFHITIDDMELTPDAFESIGSIASLVRSKLELS